MGVYDTPAKLARAQEKRLRAVVKSMEKAHKLLAESSREDFVELTGGPIDTRKVRGLYRRQGLRSRAKKSSLKGQVMRSGLVKRLPINRLTGKLQDSIKLEGPDGRQMEYRLFASAPYAKYVLNPKGTRFMVERGLLGPRGELRKRWMARRHVMVDELRRTHRSA